jgi:PKD domain-containing protein
MNRLTMPVAILACLAVAPAVRATPGGGNSAATITGAFADSCRDFTAHSSKDISHVELEYKSGSVVKDETIDSHDWAKDGGPGDEIDLARVKSGTTVEEFECVPTSAAPQALLEIQTPPHYVPTLESCYDFWAGGLACEQSSPRTAWTNASQIPDNGGSESGFFHWLCGGLTDYSLCSSTFRFRGTGSSDPDGDIASWSLDFGDGTSVSGTWSAPPAEVSHDYSPYLANCVFNGLNGVCRVTLTVTDSAGQSDSDTILMAFVDVTPD